MADIDNSLETLRVLRVLELSGSDHEAQEISSEVEIELPTEDMYNSEGSRRLFFETLQNALINGEEIQDVIEALKSLNNEEIKELYFAEYQKDNENDSPSDFPNVNQIVPINYQELVEHHQCMDLESFKAEAHDFPELLKWLSKVENSEIVTSLCGVMGSALDAVRSAIGRLQGLNELDNNFENTVSFKKLKEDSRYSEVNLRGVVEDAKKSDVLREEIKKINQTKADQIGQYKQFKDECVREYQNNNVTMNHLLKIESALEQSILNSESVLVECDTKRSEIIEDIHNSKEHHKRECEILEERYHEQENECISLILQLIETYTSLKRTGTSLAITKAKYAKFDDYSIIAFGEMNDTIIHIEKILSELKQSLQVTREANKSYDTIIHENGVNIFERNIKLVEQVYRMKEEEGKEDLSYFTNSLLGNFYRNIIGNITKSERDQDKIIEDEETQKNQLSPLNPSEYPENEKKIYAKIQSMRKVNEANLQKYKNMEKYWDSVLEVCTEFLEKWTDGKKISLQLMEENDDRYAVGNAQRFVQYLLKLNDIIEKLYQSVTNNNLNDDANVHEKKYEFYLTSLKRLTETINVSDINRPNIQPHLQELRNQIRRSVDYEKKYLNNPKFRSEYDTYCNNTSWSAMHNLHSSVFQHLSALL